MFIRKVVLETGKITFLWLAFLCLQLVLTPLGNDSDIIIPPLSMPICIDDHSLWSKLDYIRFG